MPMVPRHKTWLNAEELMASGSFEIEALGGIGPPCAVVQGLDGWRAWHGRNLATRNQICIHRQRAQPARNHGCVGREIGVVVNTSEIGLELASFIPRGLIPKPWTHVLEG